MELDARAQRSFTVLENQFYSETISAVRSANVSSRQKRIWLMDAMRALAAAEDALLEDPDDTLEAAHRTFREIALAARNA